MLYKNITGLVKIPLDHYKSSTFTSTRLFHSQNLLLTSCRTDIHKYSSSFSPQLLDSGIPCLEKSSILDHCNHLSNYYKLTTNIIIITSCGYPPCGYSYSYDISPYRFMQLLNVVGINGYSYILLLKVQCYILQVLRYSSQLCTFVSTTSSS